MKKNLLCFLFIFAFSFCFAQNNLKIYPIDSEVYKYLCTLYVREGRSLPFSQGPWSGDELKKMLETFPEHFDDEVTQNLYNKIYSILNEKSRFSTKDNFNFNLAGIFNPELYFHTNPTDFNKESDWNYGYTKRSEVLALESEVWISDAFYAYLDLGLSYAANIYSQYDADEADPLYSKYFFYNLIEPSSFSFLSPNLPRRSILSFGGEHWSASFGRDVIRWGNGESGNLLIGGNSLYDSHLRFSAYYNSFKYSVATIFYPHNSVVQNATEQNVPISGTRFFMAHRLDFRFFDDKMTLGLAEGLMYQNKSGFTDFTVMNPQIILHNLYIRGNANSIMSIDFDYSFMRNFNFYSQILIDDFAVLGEPTSSSESGWRPNKTGFLLGLKYFPPVKNGILKLSLEGVYADPYLYLREKYNDEDGTNGVSFYGHIKEFSGYSNQEIYYIRTPIGYKYGGDCITGNLRASYDSLEKWSAAVEFFYMAHGIIYEDMDGDDWIYGSQTFAPSTVDLFGSGKSGPAEHTFRLSLCGDYEFNTHITLYCGNDNFMIINKDNVERSPVFDFQFYTGVNIKF